MLKREITYEDFNGQTVTETFYFNISKPELIELEVSEQEGLSAWLKKVIDTKDHKKLVEEFKNLILLAYGQKSDDGKRFIKTEQLKEEFSQTEAYNVLFMDLASNENSAADFVRGVLPRDMAREVDKVLTPPPAPPAPAPTV